MARRRIVVATLLPEPGSPPADYERTPAVRTSSPSPSERPTHAIPIAPVRPFHLAVRPERLMFDTVNRWNIQSMFSAKDRQQEPADDAFTEELSRLKRQGASVLVVGSVRPEQQQGVSRRLLGHTSDRVRRRVLVSTSGDGHDRSLGGDPSSSDTLRVVHYESQTRSAVTQGPGDDSHATPSIDDGDTATAETLGDLGISISGAIESFESDADGLEPSELRVGIDSLLPLLEDYSTEQVFKFVHLTNGRVKDVGGMVHYQLPVEPDADVVPVLEPLFDILVELRDRNGCPQERWSLPDSGHCSGWITSPET